MRYTVDFKNKGFKPNTRGSFIHSSFTTLKELLVKLPESINFNMEIRHPRLHEAAKAGVAPVGLEINDFVGRILDQIFHDARGRKIILSSFTPDICILLAIKQQSYPVMFITNAGKLPNLVYNESDDIAPFPAVLNTYDHRVWRTGLPVRSAVLKPHAGRLVVWWVTTCESLLLVRRCVM
ncbi:hypothetical protein N7481_010891 [Penicillium waksmanii]|uniref:uncharacterized protein n=1 Tax=Penicillium waksmanii TaxID=69791 RepID=UPI00254986F8|nr:uncharacterized protein N7481_010891 [Penicillium waksmanii]KAJ5973681.1 hypothetical protein N7481_010891 [Penicillium waksmanii]